MISGSRKQVQFIVLDLEMNPVPVEANTGLAREVIEIGAVKVCCNTAVDSFQTYVRPSFGSKVCPYIRRLTGIHDAKLRNAPTFAEAMRELGEWIGMDTETVVCTWSDADRRQLLEESSAKSVVLPGNMTSYEDIQQMHHVRLGAEITRKQMALHKAAEQYGICMDSKKNHTALYDASVTAEILILLETGRFQKQAALLRKAARDRKDSPESGFLLGNLCKGIFEQMNMQAAGM